MSATPHPVSEFSPERSQLAPPELLVPWEKPGAVFLSNIVDTLCFRHALAWVGIQDHLFWKNILVPPHRPVRGFVDSILIHGLLVGALFATRNFPAHEVTIETPLRHATIAYYSVDEFLPAVQERLTPQAKQTSVTPGNEKNEVAPAPSPAKQEILSVAADQKSFRQILVTPAPLPLPHAEPLPNWITVAPPLDAPPPKLELPVMVVPPPRAHPQNRAAAVAPPAIDLHMSRMKLDLPQKAILPIGPEPAKVVQIAVAPTPVPSASPKLPVPEQKTIVVVNTPQRTSPKSEPTPQLRLQPNFQPMLSLSTTPAEVHGPLAVPLATHRESVATSPQSKAKGDGQAPGTLPPHEPASDARADISVSSPASVPTLPQRAGVTVSGSSALPTLMAKAMLDVHRPSIDTKSTAERKIRPEPGSDDANVFGGKGYYVSTIHMANLTSSAGAWELHFSELEGNSLSGVLRAPVPLEKTDPAYPADLVRDQVEGVVVLYATICADGSVKEIRVLHGVDQRLDASAAYALTKWRFAPATKDGRPIDLQAIFRVPFRTRKLSF